MDSKIKKSLYDISFKVSEEEYRADKALSYSTLARFEREGFNKLDTLFESISSPSLTFGSAVDCIITDGEDAFKDRFITAEFPSVPDSILPIIKALFNEFSTTHDNITKIPNEEVIGFASQFNYQNNWKPETRAKVIKEKGEAYYNLLYLAGDKTILDTDTYNDVIKCVEALKTSPNTKYYFADDNPFDNISRYYQLKFKAALHGINYRCMFDELIVDYDKKTIQPIDLKTSSKPEWDFYKSFIEWNYSIQNRLYTRILSKVISLDDYFKDFKILPYKDIVISRKTLVPLVWDCDFSEAEGTLTFGSNNQIIMRDPEEIAGELSYYLKYNPKVPIGITAKEGNNLRTWLNKL